MLDQWELQQQGQASPALTPAPFPPYLHQSLHLQNLQAQLRAPDRAPEGPAPAQTEPYDIYESPRALYESRRKYCTV